jgi:DNA-binding response OmpR family regulator
MPDNRRGTILLVDDEPEIRRLVTGMLKAKGYEVLCAESGETAIRLCAENAGIDLLLTDVVSPGMSGPAIADEVRALNPGVRILFMTGYDATNLVRRYRHEMGASLLVKPFTMEQLDRRISSLLADDSGSAAAGAN